MARALRFHPVEHMDDVLKYALELDEAHEFFKRGRTKDTDKGPSGAGSGGRGSHEPGVQ